MPSEGATADPDSALYVADEPLVVPSGLELVRTDPPDADLLARVRGMEQRDPEGFELCKGWALQWTPQTRADVVPDGEAHGVLDAFLRLGRGRADRAEGWGDLLEETLSFARSYGPLRLCQEHGQPMACCRVRHGSRCDVYRPEPLLLWRRWANRAAAVLQLAQDIRDGEMGPEEDWATVMGDTVEGVREFLAQPIYVDVLAKDHHVSESRRELEALSMEELTKVWNRHRVALDPDQDFWGPGWSAGEHLQMELQLWLQYGQVTPRVRWDPETGLDLQDTGRGVLGAVAHRLVAAACGAKPRIRCYWCGTLYAPKRKPRRDVDRHFCGRCRDSGVPARLRKRRQRGAES